MPFLRELKLAGLPLFIRDVEIEDLGIGREELLRAKESEKLDDGPVMLFHQMPVHVVNGA